MNIYYPQTNTLIDDIKDFVLDLNDLNLFRLIKCLNLMIRNALDGLMSEPFKCKSL